MALVREVFERWLPQAWERHHRELAAWQAARVATVSRLLGIPAERVGWGEIVWCHSQHGVPPLEDEAPRFADVPMDGRLRRAVVGR